MPLSASISTSATVLAAARARCKTCRSAGERPMIPVCGIVACRVWGFATSVAALVFVLVLPMTRFAALVEVRLRPGISDPAGATIERALPALGFDDVAEVRTGKAIRLTVDASDEVAAVERVQDLCRRFLTNPVIEDASVTVTPA